MPFGERVGFTQLDLSLFGSSFERPSGDLILALTGHRPDKLGGFDDNPLGRAVRRRMREAIEQLRPVKIISGMALGVDQWGAEIAIELGIPFIAAVPCVGQESKWFAHSKKRYFQLLDHAQHIHLCSPEPYKRGCMEKRNRWMVDNSNALLAVWNGSSGGTANCVNYAKTKRHPIFPIDPRDLKYGSS